MFLNYKMAVMQGRVDAGVRWLDGYFGREGWIGTINTRKLNLANGNTCVIGQMFGSINQHLRDNFSTIVARGTLTLPQATARGFYLPSEAWLPWTPTNAEYSELTLLWVEKIAQLSQPQAIPSPITREELAKTQ